MSTASAELDERAQLLLERLPVRYKVSLPDLLSAYARAFPDRAATVSSRADLDRLVRHATALGRIGLPAEPGTSWDRTGHPQLPRFVTRPEHRPARSAPGQLTLQLRGRVWHPQLAWVHQLERVTRSQLDDLLAVDTWLKGGGAQRPVVPREERSLQVFGGEKHIKSRIGASEVWRDGRLDEQLLRCVAPVPPLPIVTFQPHGTLLVVENRAPFWSLVQLLESDPGTVAAVGWGQGDYLLKLFPSIGRLPLQLDRCVYFGDLDAKGLAVATDAVLAARDHGLPAWEPAAALYELLRQHAVLAPRPPIAAERAAELAAWLPASLAEWAATLLTSGHRAAQEAVGLEVLAEDTRWRATL